MRRTVLASAILVFAAVPARFLMGDGFSFFTPKKIVIEAEWGKVKAPFVVAEEPKSSEGKVVYLKEKTNNKGGKPPGKDFYPGSIEFRFEVEKEGAYMLWVRKLWMNGCGNSVLCTVNEPMTKDNAKILGEDGTYDRLHWISLGREPVHLKAGKNVLRIQNREDGIKLDQFAFVEHVKDEDDPYVPQGIETPTVKDKEKDKEE